MEVCIKGAAEDLTLGDVQEVCHRIGKILVPTDGSEPAVAATEYAVLLAKTFGATVKAIFVDTGMEALEYPEEVMDDDVYEGVHASIKGLKRIALGSVAETVVKGSPIPVLVVKVD